MTLRNFGFQFWNQHEVTWRKKQENQKEKRKQVLLIYLGFYYKKQVSWSICFKMHCGKYLRGQKPFQAFLWYLQFRHKKDYLQNLSKHLVSFDLQLLLKKSGCSKNFVYNIFLFAHPEI